MTEGWERPSRRRGCIEVLLLTPWLRKFFEGSPLSLTVKRLFGDG
jgi:hypothetical protein